MSRGQEVGTEGTLMTSCCQSLQDAWAGWRLWIGTFLCILSSRHLARCWDSNACPSSPPRVQSVGSTGKRTNSPDACDVCRGGTTTRHHVPALETQYPRQWCWEMGPDGKCLGHEGSLFTKALVLMRKELGLLLLSLTLPWPLSSNMGWSSKKALPDSGIRFLDFSVSWTVSQQVLSFRNYPVSKSQG